MVTRSKTDEYTRRTRRTGPFGRLARLLLAALLGWVAVDLWADRNFVLSPPDDLLDPGLMILTGLVHYGIYRAGTLVKRGALALTVAMVLTAASAVTAALVEHTLWAGPFTWWIWGLDLVGAAAIGLMLLVATFVGTPGCELAVMRDLARRVRGEPDYDEPMFCPAGLHAIDAWERRRPRRHAE